LNIATQIEEGMATPLRLNYIGSKFKLLGWLETEIKRVTGWESFNGKCVADLFAGTGVVSYWFREQGSHVQANDAELYSSIITSALVKGTWTPKIKEFMEELNTGLEADLHLEVDSGYITKNYSPSGSDRKFFTIDNAKRIDWLRECLVNRFDLTVDERDFMNASILMAADAVSNVPAVYGCFLKKFKAKALKALVLKPIHILVTPSLKEWSAAVTRSDALALKPVKADLVYIDPPYNERQYSKNYFPLNIIAMSPTETSHLAPLKGITGIPEDCFLSPFCKKRSVLEAFKGLLERIRGSTYAVISYNSESLLSKDAMMKLLALYGTVTVVEQPYKRFKSFAYNEDKKIVEYLFMVKFTVLYQS